MEPAPKVRSPKGVQILEVDFPKAKTLSGFSRPFILRTGPFDIDQLVFSVYVKHGLP